MRSKSNELSAEKEKGWQRNLILPIPSCHDFPNEVFLIMSHMTQARVLRLLKTITYPWHIVMFYILKVKGNCVIIV